MALATTDCKEVALYLTEYSRGQLPIQEFKEVDEHLQNCNVCRRENLELEKLSIELDKIIPTVSKTYERDFIYRLFISSKQESFLAKLISVTLVIVLLFFILTTAITVRKNEYTSLKELQNRAVNIYNEEFYSGQKPDNEN